MDFSLTSVATLHFYINMFSKNAYISSIQQFSNLCS